MGLDTATSYREADSSVPASPSSDQHPSPRGPLPAPRVQGGSPPDLPSPPHGDPTGDGEASMPPWIPAGEHPTGAALVLGCKTLCSLSWLLGLSGL